MTPPGPVVIAIDGAAASGKGTLARSLAAALDYAYLDTGKLYRFIGLQMLRSGQDPGDAARAAEYAQKLIPEITSELLENPALTGDDAGAAASLVAAIPAVRATLLGFQQDFAARPPGGKQGAVIDGRDIGTVVCPAAAVKLFISASPEIRAERRFKELQSKGISVTYDAVLADMQERDRRDSERTTSPMKPAADAMRIDTTAMSAEDVLLTALSLVRGRVTKSPER